VLPAEMEEIRGRDRWPRQEFSFKKAIAQEFWGRKSQYGPGAEPR